MAEKRKWKHLKEKTSSQGQDWRHDDCVPPDYMKALPLLDD